MTDRPDAAKITAMNNGQVSELLEAMEARQTKETLDILAEAVYNAAIECKVLEATCVFEANTVPTEIQIKCIDSIANAGRTGWLASIVSKDVPDAVGIKITEVLAAKGYVEDLLRIIRKEKWNSFEKGPSEAMQERAKELLGIAALIAGKKRLALLNQNDLDDVMGIVMTRMFPLEQGGLILDDTIKKPKTYQKLAGLLKKQKKPI